MACTLTSLGGAARLDNAPPNTDNSVWTDGKEQADQADTRSETCPFLRPWGGGELPEAQSDMHRAPRTHTEALPPCSTG